jgi:AcrR family transcriptional regulator
MSDVSDSASELASDGRLRRSERSREAIVTAILELVGQGDLRPTAERVAERAGVGIRTVFRHFSDMESLYSAMAERLRAEALPPLLVESEPGGLAERAARFVKTRTDFYEKIAPYKRSANLLRWRSDYLQKDHETIARESRSHLLRFFPELKEASPDLLEVADLISSFEAWDRLRGEQKLSRTRAASAQERVLRILLAKALT